jgi:hypothetical protein
MITGSVPTATFVAPPPPLRSRGRRRRSGSGIMLPREAIRGGPGVPRGGPKGKNRRETYGRHYSRAILGPVLSIVTVEGLSLCFRTTFAPFAVAAGTLSAIVMATALYCHDSVKWGMAGIVLTVCACLVSGAHVRFIESDFYADEMFGLGVLLLAAVWWRVFGRIIDRRVGRSK